MAIVVDPDVRRLQVAVDDSAGMGVLQRSRDVDGDLDRARDLGPAAGGGQEALDVPARHVAADDERIAVVLAGVENRYDVRMLPELAHRVGLAARPRLDRGAHTGGVEQSDGHLRARGLVVGEIDPLPPALPEEALHPVAAGDLGGHVGAKESAGRTLTVAFSAASSAPQESQNRAPSRFSLPQDGHRITTTSKSGGLRNWPAGQGLSG